VPARHEIIGPMVRGLFLPEDGDMWAANDFSSQEPRLLVHYATLLGLPGAEKMAQAYRDNPDTDFHQMVADMAGIKRKAAKTIGLGLMYGMGKAKLAQQLDLPVDEASDLIGTFHSKVPFLKGTVDAVMKRIEHPSSGGSIRTLLGPQVPLPLWEPMEWGVNKALPHEQAVIAYGSRIKRSGTYKGLNRLIQGSAADQTKAGMVALHKAGFNLLLQVHDEVALSVKHLTELTLPVVLTFEVLPAMEVDGEHLPEMLDITKVGLRIIGPSGLDRVVDITKTLSEEQIMLLEDEIMENYYDADPQV
jgi:DNA polymerase I-like protein with 3'-5' exonuclease and polymerase domains